MTTYLRPTAPIAAAALLPSDPGLALQLAQELIVGPLMSNHNRGLWGYSGLTLAGDELTIQSTGIGGPSAAAVVGELARHGVRRAIRIDRATPLGPGLDPGSRLVVVCALTGDGAGRVLAGGPQALPDAALTARLRERAGPDVSAGSIVSVDSQGEASDELRAWGAERGALLSDLETAAVLAAAARAGIAAAALLAVGEPDEGNAEARDPALLELAHAGAGALGI